MFFELQNIVLSPDLNIPNNYLNRIKCFRILQLTNRQARRPKRRPWYRLYDV